MKQTKNNLGKVYRKTRKVMTINKELHCIRDVDRLHISRTEDGRKLTGCKI